MQPASDATVEHDEHDEPRAQFGDAGFEEWHLVDATSDCHAGTVEGVSTCCNGTPCKGFCWSNGAAFDCRCGDLEKCAGDRVCCAHRVPIDYTEIFFTCERVSCVPDAATD